MYQKQQETPLSDMSASSTVMSRTAAVETRQVMVEFRAATISDVRGIDWSAPEVALPAHLLMSRTEWRRATAAFPAHHPAPTERPARPPGSLIWAQLASRSGAMLVGGRDRFGMPSVPAPTADGGIVFVSAIPDDATPSDRARSPMMSLQHLIVEPDECQPIISENGEITCAWNDCSECLTVLTKNSWSTSIACMCS